MDWYGWMKSLKDLVIIGISIRVNILMKIWKKTTLLVANTESVQKKESHKFLNGLCMIKREDPKELKRLKAAYD